MNDSRKIYSCYCLFDVCCLAKAKNESFQEIGLRISNHMNNSYRFLLEKGFANVTCVSHKVFVLVVCGFLMTN